MPDVTRRRFLKGAVSAALLSPLVLPAAARRRPAAPETPYYRLRLDPLRPGFGFLTVDALGQGKLSVNPVREGTDAEDAPRCTLVEDGGTAEYRVDGAPVWSLQPLGERSFRLTSHHRPGFDTPFRLHVVQKRNHATLLGRMGAAPNVVHLPAVLHFPDRGTLRLTARGAQAVVHERSARMVPEPFIQVDLPAATAAEPLRTYDFEVVALFPDLPGLRGDPRFDAFRRNFISIFQLNPQLRVLANNTASDPCAFTLYEYAEVAPFVPPLADGLTALDLIRMTLEHYMAGTKGYGMVGYRYDGPPWGSPYDSLDSYPSLVLSAALYTLSAGDTDWFRHHRATIRAWAARMLATDADGDGLLEYGYSGNADSWKGDDTMRPANWWDTIGFGHKDAFSNAIAYRALTQLARAARQAGYRREARRYEARARRLKAAYLPTFFNPETGILGGWRSADGVLHDYWFTSVNAMAVANGLVDPPTANAIMDRLLAKMQEVGFTDFGLGLPGNLVPVRRADYSQHILRWGGGVLEDGSDGFQIYENGGATACFVYFTLKALYQLGRFDDGDRLLFPLLASMDAGAFQGHCDNGMSKDWKKWNGECWGYEGFLVDNYLALLAVVEREQLRG